MNRTWGGCDRYGEKPSDHKGNCGTSSHMQQDHEEDQENC